MATSCFASLSRKIFLQNTFFYIFALYSSLIRYEYRMSNTKLSLEGRFAETTPQPDLLMEFHLKGKRYPFAVECKWRKNERNESFEFATSEQLDRYRKYETEHKIPVFVAIGMGGEGSDPNQLFIIPLKRLKYNKISIDYLKQFEKQIDKKFYFDEEYGLLR